MRRILVPCLIIVWIVSSLPVLAEIPPLSNEQSRVLQEFWWMEQAPPQSPAIPESQSATAVHAPRTAMQEQTEQLLAITAPLPEDMPGVNDKMFYLLGVAFFTGKGVVKDLEKAAECFRRAARQGNPDAQHMLGHCYMEGLGVTPNITIGVYLMKQAIAQNHRISMFCLGECYLNGKFVKREVEKGMALLERSASLGMRRAQLSLAMRYRNGVAVCKDLVKAYSWYAVAYHDYDEEQAVLKKLEPLLTAKELAEAKNMASKVLAAVEPDKNAFASLGQ
ncbi:MAG: sel1 repeat family protein [Desulfovibrionales bacterium]|nr:sel1 repeat family protein [Desulfovibrionales bacterium]